MTKQGRETKTHHSPLRAQSGPIVAKRDWSAMNANVTLPIGPLRCFARITSASPGRSSWSYTSGRCTNITISASCSIEPDSRKSLNSGTLSPRCSLLRFNCDNTTTGTFNSFASILH